MPTYAYRIVNVFADAAAPQPRLTGNPLCVFEDARGLDTATMQALTLQFNLSESVFVLPSDKATARIRIFTTAFEMPFAGHPTLGSAHVVRALTGAGDNVTLETGAGVIPVVAKGDEWTLKANAPQTRAYAKTLNDIAQTLGISATDISEPPLWVNTGNEQLVVPLASADAVRRCRPDAARMAAEKAASDTTKIYVWAGLGGNELLARFFLMKHGAVSEDYGTGSAAANLGGWYVAHKSPMAPLPVKRAIRQGEPINRPAKLALDVDAGGSIYVGGRVIELGAGSVTL
jgi:trans-2,3-dihydro-3-hydroxyanthranilate isomerase